MEEDTNVVKAATVAWRMLTHAPEWYPWEPVTRVRVEELMRAYTPLHVGGEGLRMRQILNDVMVVSGSVRSDGAQVVLLTTSE